MTAEADTKPEPHIPRYRGSLHTAQSELRLYSIDRSEPDVHPGLVGGVWLAINNDNGHFSINLTRADAAYLRDILDAIVVANCEELT